MSSPKKAVGAVLAVLVLSAAGYAYLNPAFAATCKNTCATSFSWVKKQAGTAQAAFKQSSFYATYLKAVRQHEARAQQRKKTASAPKIAQKPAQKPLDMSPAAVRKREQANWSAGQKIAHNPANAGALKELGFKTEEQMASHIDRVIGYASPSNTKQISRDRTAYWDERTWSIIIVETRSAGGGSMFKPKQGYPYFKDLKPYTPPPP